MITYSPTTLSLDFVNNTATIAGEDYTMDRDLSPLNRNAFQQYGGPITFSRGTQATVTDNTGRLTYAPHNLLTFSEQFDNSVWIKTRSSIAPNVIADPFGNMTADKLVEDTTVSNNHQIQFANTGNTNYSNYIFSIYLKQGERRYAQIRIACSANGTPNTGDVVADLQTGIITATNNTLASGIAALGNGWYRVWSMQAHTNASQINSQVFLSTSSAYQANPTYTGDGVSGIFIWGAQLEAATYQTQPRAYIPTTTTAYFGPRLDYAPITLQPRGLLIEEARTNLLTYSEQFDNAAWIKEAASVTANTALAPNGTTTAETLTEDGTTAFHQLRNNLAPIISGTAYVYSVYAKRGIGIRDLHLRHQATPVNFQGATFDLSTGAVSNVGTSIVATATDVGGGWWRCSIAFTSNGTGSNAYINLANAGAINYTGDGTSGIFIWGAQLEAGPFTTSYIPTVASTVTRNADVVTMTGTNFSSWYNLRQGTFIGSMTLGNPIGARSCVDLRLGGSNNNQISLFLSNTAPVFLLRNNGNSNVTMAPTGTITANAIFKLGATYSSYNSAATLNGDTPATDSTREIPLTLDTMWIGSAAGVADFPNGYIRSIQYYPQRLSNNNIRLLTI